MAIKINLLAIVVINGIIVIAQVVRTNPLVIVVTIDIIAIEQVVRTYQLVIVAKKYVTIITTRWEYTQMMVFNKFSFYP
jgi:hypothetical protein